LNVACNYVVDGGTDRPSPLWGGGLQVAGNPQTHCSETSAVKHHTPMKMEQTQCSETSDGKHHTPMKMEWTQCSETSAVKHHLPMKMERHSVAKRRLLNTTRL
jgi:hypothetical protein